MSIKNYYASIVIVEMHPNDKITIESLAVSRGECSLSGAWIFSTSEKQKIENVVSGKLVVALGDQREVEEFFSSNQLKYEPTGLKDIAKYANDKYISVPNDESLTKFYTLEFDKDYKVTPKLK